MAKILVLYSDPESQSEFDHYYMRIHVPLAKKLPGLRSFVYGKPLTSSTGLPSPYYLVAELTFDSMAALGAAMKSPEGLAAAADVPKFAPQGATVLIYDTQEA